MQKRAEKTREKILKTARKLFALKGFHGVSVDEIAEKADVNKQRIYAYFDSKSGLFEASLLSAFSDVNSEDDKLLALSEKSIPDLSAIILEHYMNTHEEYPDFRRLISWANLEADNFFRCLKNIKEKSFSHLRQLYGKGQKKGFFKKNVSFETYIFSLMAISFFYYSNRQTMRNTLSSDFFSRQGVTTLVHEYVSLIKNLP